MDDQQVARLLKVAWGTYEAPTRGPRPELTHDQIVSVAIQIADIDGISAVTMARVAEHLGFTAMSLYRYVANKDELLALMTDRAGRIPPATNAEPDDWRAGLTSIATQAMQIYREHPWLLDVPTSTLSLVMPGGVSSADDVLRAMRGLPLDRDEKLAILLMITVTLRAYAALARDLTSGAKYFTPATGEFIAETITEDRFPDLAPVITSGLYAEPDDAAELDEDLGYALDRLFDGIAVRIANAANPATKPSKRS